MFANSIRALLSSEVDFVQFPRKKTVVTLSGPDNISSYETALEQINSIWEQINSIQV